MQNRDIVLGIVLQMSLTPSTSTSRSNRSRGTALTNTSATFCGPGTGKTSSLRSRNSSRRYCALIFGSSACSAPRRALDPNVSALYVYNYNSGWRSISSRIVVTRSPSLAQRFAATNSASCLDSAIDGWISDHACSKNLSIHNASPLVQWQSEVDAVRSELKMKISFCSLRTD